jgi:hypothetical protein
MLLDKRTLGCQHVSSDVRKEAVGIYEAEYVKFSLRASAYNREVIAAKQAAAAAAAAGDAAIMGEGTGGTSSSVLRSGTLFDGTCWSEDEDEDNEHSAAVEEVGAEAAALEEARMVFKAWKKYKVDWCSVYPNLRKDGALDLTEDLMHLDIGKLYTTIEALDPGRAQLGWIPAMASSSVGQLGALSAESYCERVLSCANNVVTKGNSLLSDDELEMIVVLRMNREFMQFMREHYGAEAKELFGQTVVRD